MSRPVGHEATEGLRVEPDATADAGRGVAGRLFARVAADPPAGWDSLMDSDATSSPSQRTGVAEAFAAVLPGYSVEHLVVEDASGLAGGLVMCVSRLAGIEWLHAMPLVLPGAPAARPDCREAVDAAVAAAIAERAAASHTAGGEWVCYRPGAPVAARHVERPAGETQWFQTAVIDLAGGDRRWEKDRRERYELRRAERAALAYAEDPSALEACYALHLAQSRRWPGHRPPPLALLERLLASSSAARPTARLFTVRSPRRLLGGLLVLDHAHETLAWWSGTHPEARDVSASRALMVWAISWAAAQGRARFNLGGSVGLSGVAAFKHSLGAHDVEYPVRWLSPQSARGRFLAGLKRFVRPTARRGAA